MTTPFTREEEARLRQAVASGEVTLCPRCRVPLDVKRVEPRADVAYVRTRRWLRCARCGRSLVVDAPRAGAP